VQLCDDLCLLIVLSLRVVDGVDEVCPVKTGSSGIGMPVALSSVNTVKRGIQCATNSSPPQKSQITRRSVLKGIGAAGAAATIGMPFVSRAYAQQPLRISNFGGFFEEAFAKSVYSAFTKATGIQVQSIPQLSGAQFVVQLAQANAANAAPMDICVAGQPEYIRGKE
jgi:hypothetical protein